MKLLYENTKSCSSEVGNKIDELKKVKTTVNLDNSDLPIMINGEEGDPVSDRQFFKTFTERRIKESFEKIGWAPWWP